MEQTKKHTNRLISESSPYLLQHAHNPVDWYPWNDEALKNANENNKLIIISIGYAACHWCHVMEHQSFEDEEVARLMNQYFVSIKVDREERPDIDQVYMEAAQLINGNGGWPLNVIALPDGKPIYAGTYFPKQSWMALLTQIINLYKNEKQSIFDQAEQIAQRIISPGMHTGNENFPENNNLIEKTISNWLPTMDFENGGQNKAPKFPMPNSLKFLLTAANSINNKDIHNFISLTLNKMSWGGIYDQIGGGFARYSTDEKWFAPHFEKMLYDNGQLISLYSLALKKYKNPEYLDVVNETIRFAQSELLSSKGGFYSSLDADSEGTEGKYYVWKLPDINNLPVEYRELIIEYYNVTQQGNWENESNILFRTQSVKQFCTENKIEENNFTSALNESKTELKKIRDKRIKPALDDKILTSWNALMVTGIIDAYIVTQNINYLKLAEKTVMFLISNMTDENGRIWRIYKNGKTAINGFLDDYAFTIESLIKYYSITLNEQILYKAKQIMDYALAHFSDEENSLFFYTSNIDAPLIARKKEIYDNVIPSSNSQMALNLFTLGNLFSDEAYIEKSKQMLHQVKSIIPKGGPYSSNWAMLHLIVASPKLEVAITGKNAVDISLSIQNQIDKNITIAGNLTQSELPLLKDRWVEGKTMIYVCINNTCNVPTESIQEALEQLKNPVEN